MTIPPSGRREPWPRGTAIYTGYCGHRVQVVPVEPESASLAEEEEWNVDHVASAGGSLNVRPPVFLNAVGAPLPNAALLKVTFDLPLETLKTACVRPCRRRRQNFAG